MAGAQPVPLIGATGGERLGLFSSCLPGWDAQRVIEAARWLQFACVEWGAGPGEAIGIEMEIVTMEKLSVDQRG